MLLAAIGLGVGAFGTLIGAGGGFILTPILLLLYPHDSAQTLTAISLAAVFFNAASGTTAYARQRRIDYRSGIVFALATLPGAIGGALVVGVVSRRVFGRCRSRSATSSIECSWTAAANGTSTTSRCGAGRSTASVSAFFSSFLGIGGGVIHVPLLVRALGFPTHLATATSHFVLAIMAGTGTATHIVLGSFSHGRGLRRAAALSVGVVAGAQLGAHVSLRFRGAVIQWLLAGALLALSARLLCSA